MSLYLRSPPLSLQPDTQHKTYVMRQVRGLSTSVPATDGGGRGRDVEGPGTFFVRIFSGAGWKNDLLSYAVPPVDPRLRQNTSANGYKTGGV